MTLARRNDLPYNRAMLFLRALSVIGLVLVLVSGSVTMAAARHQARAVGEAVICTGYGIATISLDAEGNPTGPVVLCPDCVPALAALTGDVTPGVQVPARLVPLRFASIEVSATLLPAPRHFRSRAPPASA